MAQALRNNHDSLLECSFYSATSEDIYLRSGIHEVAMDGEPCTGDYWVETIDLIAWSLETKKKVCVITDSDHEVMVYSGISQPESIQLADFSPNADDIVMFYVGGVHYETLLHFNENFVKVEDFLDDYYAKNGRSLTEEEYTRFLRQVNAVRNLRSEPFIDLSTLQEALSLWTPRHTGVAHSRPLHDFIDEFYTERRRQPTAEELLPLVNDARSESSHALIGLKSLREAISIWKQAHPDFEKVKSVHDCIDDIYAEIGRPPTTDELRSRMNEVRGESNGNSCCQSTLLKSISRWRRTHSEVTEFKKLQAFIDDFFAENKRPPKPRDHHTLLARVNTARAECGRSTLIKLPTLRNAIAKWNKAHPNAEQLYETSEAASEGSEAEAWVHTLTEGSAIRGAREEGHIKPPSNDMKERIQVLIDEYLTLNAAKLSTCACCDELCRHETTHDVNVDAHWIERLRIRLGWEGYEPNEVREYYDVSKVDSRLHEVRDVALSPRGIIEAKDGGCSMLRFCKPCYTSLNKSQLRSPPKFSIANGWGIGDIPTCFVDASWAEKQMVTLAPISGLVKVIGRNGTRRKLHSHTMALINEPGPASTYIPQDINREDYQVVFSNANDNDIDYAKKKFARVRKNVVHNLTTFVTNHNSAYAEVERRQSKIESMENDYIHPDICVKDDEGNLIKEVINDGSRVNTANDSSGDTSVVETSGGLFDLRPPAPPDEDTIEEVDPIRRFQVLHSNTYLGSRDSKYYGGAFPELFCYGTGTPNSPRRVPVSLELGLRHLLLLSDRRFAQSAIFSLVAFDELARSRAHSNLAVKLRANPKAANEMVSLSAEALKELLYHNEKLEQAARAGRPLPELHTSTELSGAKSIFSILSNSAGKSFGTKEERLEMRKRVYAYYHTFGRPHLMVTASPRDDNSFWLAVNAGFDASTPSSAAQSFDDLCSSDKVFPDQDDIRRAALKDPTLAAVRFDNFAGFFFDQIVGWDKEAGKAHETGGLFGKAVAYTAGVETQGGGTLHFHALITLEDFPATQNEEKRWECGSENANGSTHFENEYCAYADALASAVYPIYQPFLGHDSMTKSMHGNTATKEAVLHCPLCATGKLQSKDIKFIAKTNQVEYAPRVCACTTCKKSFTAQSLRIACTRVLAKIGQVELKGLNERIAQLLSESSASFPVPTRLCDSSKATLSRAMSVAFSKLPTVDEAGLEEASHDVNHECNYDERDYCHEVDTDLNQEGNVELPEDIQQYIQSCIELTHAIQLSQEHKWEHVGSCFKGCNKKTRKGKICVCRYDRPRDKISSKTILSSVEKLRKDVTYADNELHLRSVVGCNYLTPYSEILFSILKSNHDIAFLRGRSIMYSVKYTTKPQETADSTAIVNRLTAGFEHALKRKEEQEEEHPEWSDVRRGTGRLHSLLYQLTSLQEVANTMACLYVYRNKPAFYESHPAATLVLSSALSAERNEEHTLSVSPFPSENGQHACYSAYDNYLHRPSELSGVSWFDYEGCFEMVDKPKNFDNDYDEEEQPLCRGLRLKHNI